MNPEWAGGLDYPTQIELEGASRKAGRLCCKDYTRNPGQRINGLPRALSVPEPVVSLRASRTVADPSNVSSLVRGSEMRVAELCSWLAIGITWNCPSRVRCKNLVEVQFLRTTISAALVDL
jgi:hypothetical protein